MKYQWYLYFLYSAQHLLEHTAERGELAASVRQEHAPDEERVDGPEVRDEPERARPARPASEDLAVRSRDRDIPEVLIPEFVLICF